MSDKISAAVEAANSANGFDADAANVFTIDGTTKRWPVTLNGLNVRFNLPTAFETVPGELAGSFEDAEALNHALGVATRNLLLGELSSWLKAKPEGSNSERGGTVTAADVVAFCATAKVSAPQRKAGGAKQTVSILRETVKAKDAKLDAAQEMMLAMLADLPKAARAAQVDRMRAAGMLPADYTDAS